MKKTIIALLALSGVVSAAVTTWDSTLGPATLTPSGTNVKSWNVSLSNMTWKSGAEESIIFTVDAKSFNTTDSYTLLSIQDSNFNGLSNVYISGGNLYLHTYNNSTASATKALSAIITEDTDTLTLVWNRTSANKVVLDVYADDVFTSKAWTYTYTSNADNGFSFGDKKFQKLNFGGTEGTLTGQIASNGLIPSGATAKQWNLLGAGYTYNSLVTSAELKTYYSAVVPEPTTATLSLLALAGLAARRRRK